MPKNLNQFPQKLIFSRLKELGVDALVRLALTGDVGAKLKLSRAAQADTEIRVALELILPRRNPKNQARREKLSPVERAGNQFKGPPSFVQGGSPGLRGKK